MLRAIANSFVSILLAVTMLWGGCISCPQFFMLPGADTNCCDDTGRCKKKPQEPPTEKQCQTMPLELQPSGGVHSPLIPIAEVEEIHVAQIAFNLGVNVRGWEDASQREHSPPDLQALYAIYLI